jgi:hypothetical protein
MTHVRISSHAISRYRERVAALTEAEVRAVLDTPRIAEMIEFGAREIVLGSGHHAVVADGAIVTIRPKPFEKRRERPERACRNCFHERSHLS